MRVPPVSVPPAVLRAALKSRARLQNLVDRGVPAEIALLDLTWGVQRTAVAGALVTPGLADALGEDSRHPAELADELDLDSEVTVRISRTALIARLVAWNRVLSAVQFRHEMAPSRRSRWGRRDRASRPALARLW